MSKTELAREIESSLPTVSRRVDKLLTAGFLRESTRIRSDGNHDTVYIAELDRVEFVLRNGTLEYEIEYRKRDMSDKIQELWGKF